MAKVPFFKGPELKAKNTRNAFDRSQKKLFSTPFGAILPAGCWRVCPGDHIELSCESQFVSENLVKPSFMRLKEHIDYFFVPMSQMWMPSDNFFTGQDYYFSSALQSINASNKVPQQVPTFSTDALKTALKLCSNAQDLHGFNSMYNSLRLLDLLEYGNYYHDAAKIADGTTSMFATDVRMNPFALLAYQKVYYDFYRNIRYEANSPLAYNIDQMNSSANIAAQMLFQGGNGMLNLHYRWAKKDYFMDVQPNVLADTSLIGFNGLLGNSPTEKEALGLFGVPGAAEDGVIADAYQFPTSSYSGVTQNAGLTVEKGANTSNDVTSGHLVDGAINVAQLRFMFAYDKLLRRMREAGGTFDAQMLAQFGITPYDQRHGKCHFIGGQTNRLYASDITSTSDPNSSSGDGLGTLGGNINVYSTGKDTFKFDVKEFGLVICMYSTSLDFDYPSTSINRDNCARYRFDWFNPAFENLGQQPVFQFELDAQQKLTNGESGDLLTLDNLRSIIGYQRRYAEYKTSVDKVHGLFANQQNASLAPWTTQYENIRFDGTGQYDPWAIGALDQEKMTFNPSQVDRIMKVDYDGTWETDPFIVNLYTHFKCISNMSSYGEVF